MQRFFTLILALFLSGCVSFSAPEKSKLEVKRSFLSTDQLTIGMTQQGADNILGKEIRIGYKSNKDLSQNPEPIFIKNPFRAEILKIKNRTYDVFFYLTAIKKDDGVVSDDELTPLIFENNRLVGKDWNFLFELKKQIGV